MLWAGRRVFWTVRLAWVGPEGLPSRDGSPLRHMDRKVGPGKAYVRKLYIGELTKHLCLQLLCMCFRY